MNMLGIFEIAPRGSGSASNFTFVKYNIFGTKCKSDRGAVSWSRRHSRCCSCSIAPLCLTENTTRDPGGESCRGVGPVEDRAWARFISALPLPASLPAAPEETPWSLLSCCCGLGLAPCPCCRHGCGTSPTRTRCARNSSSGGSRRGWRGRPQNGWSNPAGDRRTAAGARRRSPRIPPAMAGAADGEREVIADAK
jgi:hypothetical protein